MWWTVFGQTYLSLNLTSWKEKIITLGFFWKVLILEEYRCPSTTLLIFIRTKKATIQCCQIYLALHINQVIDSDLFHTTVINNKPITYALVMALYRSWPAVSQIWAFIVFPSTWILLKKNYQNLNSWKASRSIDWLGMPIAYALTIHEYLFSSFDN